MINHLLIMTLRRDGIAMHIRIQRTPDFIPYYKIVQFDSKSSLYRIEHYESIDGEGNYSKIDEDLCQSANEVYSVLESDLPIRLERTAIITISRSKINDGNANADSLESICRSINQYYNDESMINFESFLDKQLMLEALSILAIETQNEYIKWDSTID